MNIKLVTANKLLKGILNAIEKSDNLTGTTVDVTSKQYDEIVRNKKLYIEILGMTDLEKVTGYKVTSIGAFTKNFPLFGTKVIVFFEKVN